VKVLKSFKMPVTIVPHLEYRNTFCECWRS
jgi:hypothetical protein